jgi:ABC-type Fe3+-siderophore transport system permease subunit
VRAIGLLAMSAALYRLTLRRPLRDASLLGVAGAHFGAQTVAFWCGVGYLVANTVPLSVRSVRLFRLVEGDSD